jgi:hypothetical protein
MRQVLSGLALALALMPWGASAQMVGGSAGVWHPGVPRVDDPGVRSRAELMRQGVTRGTVQVVRPTGPPADARPRVKTGDIMLPGGGQPGLETGRLLPQGGSYLGALPPTSRAETATITYDAAARAGEFTTSAGTCLFGLLVLDRPHLPKQGIPVYGPIAVQCPQTVGYGGGSWAHLPDGTVLIHVKTDTGIKFNFRHEPSGR